jgi:hypothetical protein
MFAVCLSVRRLQMALSCLFFSVMLSAADVCVLASFLNQSVNNSVQCTAVQLCLESRQCLQRRQHQTPTNTDQHIEEEV